ncbi:MAG: 6-aminohexanoate hydrolase, partial [Mesorhizobium sp.]
SGKHGPHFSPSLPDGSYCNQFWIEDPRSRALMCKGVFGQMIHISWEHRMVVVKLSTYPDFLNAAYSVATLKAVHAIAAALG